MTVLIDTSIWSLMLRRDRHRLSREQETQVAALEELVAAGRARLMGAVRQELLTGIRHKHHFLRLRQGLRTFPDVELQIEDYEGATEVSNVCEAHGVIGSSVDMLLCSVALRRGWAIYTSDRDFQRYAKYASIALFS